MRKIAELFICIFFFNGNCLEVILTAKFHFLLMFDENRIFDVKLSKIKKIEKLKVEKK